MNRRDFFARLGGAAVAIPFLSKLAPKPVANSVSFPPYNWIELPIETGDITSIVHEPYGNAVLIFTKRAMYRAEHMGGRTKYEGRRFWAEWMDANYARVTKERYL